MLNGLISSETFPLKISDYDEDGTVELMVKFNMQDVQNILEIGDNIEIIISGELNDGTRFEGLDYIRVF